jgi:hypothetical protein
MAKSSSSRRSGGAMPVPALVKRKITAWGDDLIAREFRIDRENEANAQQFGFNYAVAVYGEWRGRSYYLCAKYRRARGGPEDEFVVRQTRMTYTGPDRFDLSYFRHTNRWQLVFSELTMAECCETIEQEEIFWPVT